MAKRPHGWDEEYERQREEEQKSERQQGGWMDGDAWLGQGEGEFARIWKQKMDQGLVRDGDAAPTA